MKALFFSILTFNTAFFLWEYRQGAPEIYYPQEAVEVLAENTEQIIFLPSEIEELGIEIDIAETESIEQERLFITENTKTEESNVERTSTAIIPLAHKPEKNLAELDIETTKISVLKEIPDVSEKVSIVLLNEESRIEGTAEVEEVKTLPLADKPENLLTELDVATVETRVINETPGILVKESNLGAENKLVGISEEIGVKPELEKVATLEEKELCFQVFEQELEPLQKEIKDYQFSVIKQSEQAVNYYFLLTKRSQSFALMNSNAQLIRQKGLDTWMIEKGEFNQRISLGVFSNPKNVKNAKIAYMKKIGQPLEIVPQYKNKEKKYLKITLPEHKLETLMTVLAAYKLKPKQCDAITDSRN